MEFSKITAIIRSDKVETIEKELLRLKVPGVSISKGKGFSDNPNFLSQEWAMTHVRVEVFIGKHRADEIAIAIMNVAHSGVQGDGIVAISPVETIYHIRKKEKCQYDVCE